MMGKSHERIKSAAGKKTQSSIVNLPQREGEHEAKLNRAKQSKARDSKGKAEKN
jgi:hypothetical protein